MLFSSRKPLAVTAPDPLYFQIHSHLPLSYSQMAPKSRKAIGARKFTGTSTTLAQASKERSSHIDLTEQPKESTEVTQNQSVPGSHQAS